MTRQSRMLLVLGVIAVVAVVVLAVIARQYARVATPTRSVADVEPMVATPGAFQGKVAPLEVAPDSTSTADGVGHEGASTVAAGQETDPDGPAAALDDETAARLRAFVAGRRAVAAFVEEKPDVALSLVDEAEGYKMGREQIQMHNYDMLGLRVSKVKAIEAAGGTEDDYRSIREQYRLWRDGGEVDPDWALAFDAAGSMLDPADLGRYEPLDY